MPWNFQALVPVTQFWEGTRTVPWHWWQNREQQLSHSPNWADFPNYCSVAVRVPGQAGPAFRSHPQGAQESWSWSIWMKREESENTGVFYLPAISSECIPFQCRKVHLMHFNLLCFCFLCWDFLWTIPPDLTSRSEKHMMKPDQSKPCSAIKLTAKFHKMTLPSSIKTAENIIFFSLFFNKPV